MKATKIFMMAALALMTAACSSDDNDIAQQPAEQPANGEITITATIDSNDGATTRALGIDGSNIASIWADTDQFAILFNDGTNDIKRTATVSSINGTTVTITFTIPQALANNTACTIVYPASAANATNTGADVATALATQNGAIATTPEVRVGTATIDKTNHSLTSVTKLAAQNAIFKFTLKDIAGTANKAATQFIVSNASGDVLTTVTPASATSELYVALPALAVGTYWFNATVGGKPYIAKSTVSTATTTGNYYQTQVNMATLGDLMAANGKFYADGTAAAAAPTTPVGVIAYLGSDAFTENGTNVGGNTFAGHGLVLCLKNAASNIKWSTEYVSKFPGQEVDDVDDLKRSENVSGYTNTATLTVDDATEAKYPAAAAAKNYTPAGPAGTTGWFLPSAQQWVRMMTGLGGLSESDITWRSWFNNDHSAATAWENAMAKAGTKGTAYESMTDDCLWYWSSSEYSGSNAVYLDVDATATGGEKGFYWDRDGKDGSDDWYRVRPVLAF